MFSFLFEWDIDLSRVEHVSTTMSKCQWKLKRLSMYTSSLNSNRDCSSGSALTLPSSELIWAGTCLRSDGATSTSGGVFVKSSANKRKRDSFWCFPFFMIDKFFLMGLFVV